MRVAWVHSFPAAVADAGSFMYPLAEAMTNAGVEIEWLRLEALGSPLGLIRSILRARTLATSWPIIHAQYGSGCGLVASMVPGKRVITLRGSDWYGNGPVSGFGPVLRSKVTQWLTRLTLRRFDLIVCMSDRMAADVRRTARGTQVIVLPDPIDLDSFRPVNRDEARASLGCADDDRSWVLFPSFNGYRSVKRPELAEATIHELKSRGVRAHLHAVTNVPKRDMPLHISACDAVLVTSTHEGWPNIVKEGLACGVPFVSTDVSDLARIAKTHPSCSVCAPTPSALADGLVRALQADRDPGLRALVEHMAPSLSTRTLMVAYHGVLANGG